MQKQKMSLQNLKLKSFTTSLPSERSQELKGGGWQPTIDRCSLSACKKLY